MSREFDDLRGNTGIRFCTSRPVVHFQEQCDPRLFCRRHRDPRTLFAFQVSSFCQSHSLRLTMVNIAQQWVRGVNLGSWLLLERYIVPYQFALTDCHVAGDLCWYPGQLSAPPSDDPAYKLCDLSQCKPLKDVDGNVAYPVDEKTLAETFVRYGSGDNATGYHIAEQWLNYHFDNFLRREDLIDLRDAGITHVRVPLPHWMMGDVVEGESWIVGKRWEYFVRLCQWARELGLQVWPDIHTAPGSQNGFGKWQADPPDSLPNFLPVYRQLRRSFAIHDV